MIAKASLKSRSSQGVMIQLKKSFFLISSLFFAGACFADNSDTLNFVAGASRQYDNNIFRSAGNARSDNINTAYLGIRLDKNYGMQRIKFDFTRSSYRYQKSNFLNFDANDYKATWLWALTPKLTGTLSSERNQQLVDYKDFRNTTVQNIRTTKIHRFEMDFSLRNNWHLLGGMTRYEGLNSKLFNAQDDFRMNGIDYGIRYVFPSQNTISLMGHTRRGEYERVLNPLFFYDTGYDESEVEATMQWILTGKSRLNMRLAHISREHDHFSLRNYSGQVGKIEYTWTPTSKLQLNVSATRDMASYETNTSSYTESNTFGISPAYWLSDKIMMRANASYSVRDFEGRGILLSDNREDRTRSASVSINWSPLTNISIGINLQKSRRDSNIDLFDYRDTSMGVSANLEL